MGYRAGRALCLLFHGTVLRRYGEWRTWSHRCAGDRPHRCTCRSSVVSVVAHAAWMARVAIPTTCGWCTTRRERAVQIRTPPNVFRDRAFHARRWTCVRQSRGAAHLVHLPRLLHGQDRARGGDARGNCSWLSRVQIRGCLEIDPLCNVETVPVVGQRSEN